MVYHYDANNILTKPLKNITGPCILNGLKNINENLRNQGVAHKLNIMENELLEELKQFYEKTDIQYQFV